MLLLHKSIHIFILSSPKPKSTQIHLRPPPIPSKMASQHPPLLLHHRCRHRRRQSPFCLPHPLQNHEECTSLAKTRETQQSTLMALHRTARFTRHRASLLSQARKHLQLRHGSSLTPAVMNLRDCKQLPCLVISAGAFSSCARMAQDLDAAVITRCERWAFSWTANRTSSLARTP